MGLGRFQAEFLLAEHRYRPIQGRLLTIARQTVGMTPAQALKLLADTGTPVRADAQLALDTKTRGHALTDDLISDDSFYSLFTDAKLSILDVSDYEGADVIHDMNDPIGPELENRFDFVLCGSCLDNIFDAVTALKNLARLVKPGGRIFLFEWGNSFPTAYLKFTPDWFLDYFAANRFADCKAYLLHYPSLDRKGVYTGSGPLIDLYHYDPLVEHSGQTGYQCTHPQSLCYTCNYVIAEKGAGSTWNASPIQVHYRMTDAIKQVYLESAVRFRQSPRPLFRRPGRPVHGDPELSRFGTLKPLASWDAP